MRFHHAESMTNIDYYIPMAQAAEANGYAGVISKAELSSILFTGDWAGPMRMDE